MRALALALLLLAAPLAGCLAGSEPPPRDDGPAERQDPPPQPEPDAVRAPSLIPGLAWTYELDGAHAAADEIQVVVALAGADGYLFAGGDEESLVGEVAWNRTWLGWQDYHLNPKGGDEAPLFRFPLEDGDSWSFHDATATANKAPVQTPIGTVDGFEITTSEEDTQRSWTFAREIGYLVTYTEEQDGTVLLDLQMTGVDRLEEATWYQAHGQARAEGSTDAQAEIPEEATAVVLSAGGAPGSTATVLPPLGSSQPPWTILVEDEPQLSYEVRDGEPGTWRATASSFPDADGVASVNGVSWIPVEPRYGSNP